MKFISYAELEGNGNYPSIKGWISGKGYPNKERIVRFLLHGGDVECVQHSRDKDVFTGEIIPYEVKVMRSGEYYWPSILAWYVEHYNLRLPQEFEEFILSK